MPKIKTENGVIEYKTHPLFLGVKKIDKEQATENLLLLKKFLDEHNVNFGLIAGTLLGAVREHDFISHDEDIDIFILGEQKQRFLSLLHKIRENGFQVARYDRRGLLSIIRKGEYIDMYFFEKHCDGIRNCCGWCVPEVFLTDTTHLEFKGELFVVPKDYIGFLEYEYGYNWMTPVQWANFELPKWQRNLHEWKEKTKELLPDFIFYPIVKRFEIKLMKKYQTCIERYNIRYKTNLRII